MSYWSHNPELYDEIIVKEAKARGIIDEDDEQFNYDIVKKLEQRDDFSKICLSAERDYWGGKIDEVMMRKGDK